MAVAAEPRASAVDWRQTIAFIDQNGSEMERARLRGILGRARPDARAVRTLEARQNDDGGFPYGLVPGRLSTIAATAAALEWMRDLGLLGGPQAERAFIYLQSVQRPDGSWDEPPGLIRYAPPPRLLPGDRRVRVLSTALVAYWLALVGRGSDPAVLRAMEYLRDRQASAGRFVGFRQATWLAAGLFRIVEGPGSEAATHALDALGMVADTRWRPGALSEMLNALGDAGVPDDAVLIRRSLTRLAALARPDGSWLSEDGDLYHVETTLRGLRAILLYGAVAAPKAGTPEGGAAPSAV